MTNLEKRELNKCPVCYAPFGSGMVTVENLMLAYCSLNCFTRNIPILFEDLGMESLID